MGCWIYSSRWLRRMLCESARRPQAAELLYPLTWLEAAMELMPASSIGMASCDLWRLHLMLFASSLSLLNYSAYSAETMGHPCCRRLKRARCSNIGQ